MYDENLSILEDADYNGDIFWLQEECLDSFSSDIDDEMDMITIDRAAYLIEEMARRFNDIDSSADGSVRILREAASKIAINIEDFLSAYTRLKEMRN